MTSVGAPSGAKKAPQVAAVSVAVVPESDGVGLVPKWAGQFDNFDQWVNRASRYLTGARGSMGENLAPMCVDTLGRRCHIGHDFMRARDEKTFPIRFFWECEPATAQSQESTAPASSPVPEVTGA